MFTERMPSVGLRRHFRSVIRKRHQHKPCVNDDTQSEPDKWPSNNDTPYPNKWLYERSRSKHLTYLNWCIFFARTFCCIDKSPPGPGRIYHSRTFFQASDRYRIVAWIFQYMESLLHSCKPCRVHVNYNKSTRYLQVVKFKSINKKTGIDCNFLTNHYQM